LQGDVRAIAVSGSTVYLGGTFETSTAGRRNLVAVSLASATPNAFTPSPDATVASIAASPSYLAVGGAFNTIAGAARGRFAAWSGS
jgi:hypothetical protein